MCVILRFKHVLVQSINIYSTEKNYQHCVISMTLSCQTDRNVTIDECVQRFYFIDETRKEDVSCNFEIASIFFQRQLLKCKNLTFPHTYRSPSLFQKEMTSQSIWKTARITIHKENDQFYLKVNNLNKHIIHLIFHL